MARIIRVEPLLSRLSSLSATKTPAATGLSLEEMSLHQQITEAVVVSSLDVDHVVDQIDNERAQMVELQSILLAP
jgi:predicted DNA-binding ribbon-helix-helix protein